MADLGADSFLGLERSSSRSIRDQFDRKDSTLLPNITHMRMLPEG
jgi:hypothetical protein